MNSSPGPHCSSEWLVPPTHLRCSLLARSRTSQCGRVSSSSALLRATVDPTHLPPSFRHCRMQTCNVPHPASADTAAATGGGGDRWLWGLARAYPGPGSGRANPRARVCHFRSSGSGDRERGGWRRPTLGRALPTPPLSAAPFGAGRGPTWCRPEARAGPGRGSTKPTDRLLWLSFLLQWAAETWLGPISVHCAAPGKIIAKSLCPFQIHCIIIVQHRGESLRNHCVHFKFIA